MFPQAGIESATEVYAQDWTLDLLVYQMMLQPTEPPDQDKGYSFLSRKN